MCFVNMEKAIDRVPKGAMGWAMGKRGLSEVVILAVVSLYDGAKTGVGLVSACSEEFDVGVGVH